MFGIFMQLKNSLKTYLFSIWKNASVYLSFTIKTNNENNYINLGTKTHAKKQHAGQLCVGIVSEGCGN